MCRGVDPRELAAEALLAAQVAAAGAQGGKQQQQQQQQRAAPSIESFFDFDELVTAPCAFGGATSAAGGASAQEEGISEEKRRMQVEAGFHTDLLDDGIALPSFFDDDALMDDTFFQDLTASFNDEAAQSDSHTDTTASPFSEDSSEQETSQGELPYFHIQLPESVVFRQELPVVAVKAEVQSPPAAHVPAQLQRKAKASASAAALSVADDGKLSKWRRRDIQKHLAGERNRRAKRMGKIHILQAMIEGLPKKPTVNQILQAAIAEIQRVKAEGAQAPAQAAPRVDLKEVLRSSPTMATLVLDANNNVLEASGAMLETLRWPGGEQSIVGQYLASVMHPDDAVALMNEAKWFRSTATCETSVQAVRMAVTFSRFAPMPGFEDSFSSTSSGGFCGAFPQGYTQPACINVSITKNKMFLSME